MADQSTKILKDQLLNVYSQKKLPKEIECNEFFWSTKIFKKIVRFFP